MRKQRYLTHLLLWTFVVLHALVPPTSNAVEILGRFKRLFGETKYQGTKPAMGHDCAVECLAENIDWLEHHIDTYGSVVAKQPDIWGEARLTKHRDEYERMMFGQLGGFTDTINAAISQKDASFLSQAMALSSAVSGGTVSGAPADAANAVSGVTIGAPNAALKNVDAGSVNYQMFGVAEQAEGESPKATINLEPVLSLDQRSRYLKHLHELRRVNEGDDTSDSPGYSLNLVRIPVSISPGKLTQKGFGAEVTVTAEPVISDDLMPTTFQNLAVNDVVDFMGLPLVRVTERLDAYEAQQSKIAFERTMKAINDAFDQHADEQGFVKAAEPLVRDFIENELAYKSLQLVHEEIIRRAYTEAEVETVLLPETRVSPMLDSELKSIVQRLDASTISRFRTTEEQVTVQRIDKSTGVVTNEYELLTLDKPIHENEILTLISALREKNTAKTAATLHRISRNSKLIPSLVGHALSVVGELASSVGAAAPSGRARRSLNPINPSSLENVIGTESFVTIATSFERAYYGRHIRWRGGSRTDECGEHRVDLLDARKFLNAEVKAAHQLLSEPDHVRLFAQLASPDSTLATQIRNGHFTGDQPGRAAVDSFRHYFFQELHNHNRGAATLNDELMMIDMLSDEACHDDSHSIQAKVANCDRSAEAESSVEALAWAILVESALLNQRLNRDVRKLAKAKEAFGLNTQRDHWFFLPDTVAKPGLEAYQLEFQAATDVFKEYVRVRWPIHVFAVDPVNQDQNVADVSQRKRELQFALALGFATGQIGVNSLTQFSRELETQVETISLNRTIVGFGHGADTFGWKFYPRVQALHTPGTLGVIRETLMGTSRDYDLKHRQIEPGQRECVAIVLMPSFVPYADFDIRTDWFKITNPKNTALTMKDSLQLSRAVTAMRDSQAKCANFQHLYREGEVRRLFKRIDQLDRELPLQTHRSMVPYENTLGGFEMFNTGVTDLSPELVGWYGAPGVNTNAAADSCGCTVGCASKVEITDDMKCGTPAECAALAKAIGGLNDAVGNSNVAACTGVGTTLFLVGDNFSIHDTKVIAGGTCIPNIRLISRELMQVTIPSCVNTVELCENGKTSKYVAVYVATPYGVTNHLHVPIMETAAAAASDCGSSDVTVNAPSVLAPASVRTQVDADLSRRQTRFGPSPQPSRVTSDRGEFRLASLMQSPQEFETIGLLNELTKKLDSLDAKLEEVTASVAVSRAAVNVSYPGQPTRDIRSTLSERLNLPLLNGLRASATEQWKNCRDQLPQI